MTRVRCQGCRGKCFKVELVAYDNGRSVGARECEDCDRWGYIVVTPTVSPHPDYLDTIELAS